MINTTADSPEFQALIDIPEIDIPLNTQAAIKAGRTRLSMFWEQRALARGPGKLSKNEYFYYRLWDPALTHADKRAFVGKMAQTPMHMTCNQVTWYAPAADKLLFQMLMKGAGLAVPDLLAVTHGGRSAGARIPTLDSADAIAAFLREPSYYPLFIKPIDGKFSLFVTNADSIDTAADEVVLRDGRRGIADLVAELAGHGAGYVIQRRLNTHPELAERFGPALWSVRVIVLMTPTGPVVPRAVVKIATGQNPADNFWRSGNMLGAVELNEGVITRVVRGTGCEQRIDEPHPDTGAMVTGAKLPDWEALKGLVGYASLMLPGIRTQSWDVALTDKGPVLLEVNWGGDLHLTQLAQGQGMLNDTYIEHLRSCGYTI